MTIEERNQVKRKVLYHLIYAIFLLGTIAAFYAGPRAEALIYPPVDLFEITEVKRLSDDEIEISGIMHKQRGECVVQDVVLTTGGPPGATNTEILEVDFQDKVRTRPQGGQNWGPWIIKDNGVHGAIFTIYAQHRCHLFWNVSTVLFRGTSSAIFGEQR